MDTQPVRTGLPVPPVIDTGSSVSIDATLTSTGPFGTSLDAGLTLERALGEAPRSWVSNGSTLAVTSIEEAG